MWEIVSRYRQHLVVLLLVAVPVTSLALSRGRPGRGPVDSLAISGLAVVQSGGFFGLSFVEELWRDYVALRDLKEENTQLRAEVARLREERGRLLGVLQENARLRSLLAYKQERADLGLQPARVIAKDVTPYFRVVRVRLDTGLVDTEVKPQMPVVSHEGVVGQVVEVYDGYADVMLLSDPRSSIDVVTQRNRTRGMVNGKGHKRDYEAEMAYVQSKDEVVQGDIVVTSGKGGLFPQELLVGRVLRVERNPSGLHQDVVVEPLVDYGRLEEVFIITGSEAAGGRP